MTSAGSVADPQQPGAPLVASVIPLLPAWRLDRVFDYLVPPDFGPVAKGSLVRAPFGGRKVRAVVVDLAERPSERELQPLDKLVLDVPVAPSPLSELAEWIATRYGVPLGKALDRFVPPRVRIAKKAVTSLTGGPEPQLLRVYEHGPELIGAIEGGRPGVWCVSALPSHDRGALIAELVAAAGRGGGSALVAVPEVRFGSNVLDRLAEIWPDMARVDSAQEDKQRAEAWSQLARGHGLGGGGRSTVFAPCPSLRLIVIDEEQHRTFKEDRSPRYNARRVAIERARLQGALCLLVSDAPTLETAGGAARGDVGWVQPSRAARKEARPVIEVAEPAGDTDISELLFRRIREALRDDLDVAVLAPRRGYAPVLWCAACRRSVRCPRCEAALAIHSAGGRNVRCPRCAFLAAAPPACPSCGADDFRYVGAGSERLTEQLAKAFPRARVGRMDPSALEETGPDVGPTDIYVTTWIGTKREIRPEAKLVAVLDADALIRRPDLRAAEDGWASLSAMARWAGPAAAGGRLVIQTGEPSHHAIQAIVRGDPRFFLEREMELREELSYPPFTELVRISGPKEAVERAAEVASSTPARVLGPLETHSRIAGEETTWEFLAKAPSADTLMRALRPLLRSTEGAGLRVDADPR